MAKDALQMATPAGSNSSLETMVNNIMGHTVDILNLLRTKAAIETAMKGGASEDKQTALFRQFLKQFPALNEKGNRVGFSSFFKDAKNNFRDVASVMKQYRASVISSKVAVSNFTQTVTQATKATKNYYGQAKNTAYIVARGKYVQATPFTQGRTKAANLADILSAGASDWLKNRVIDPNKNVSWQGLRKITGNPFTATGLMLRRWVSGSALGGGVKGALGAAGVGALMSTALKAYSGLAALGAWAAGRWTDALKTSLSAGSLSMGMAARGAGAGWGQRDITGAIFRGRLIGASSEEARNALTQGQMAGLTLEQSMSALSATKALGISNAVAKTQTVARRILGQDPNDPAKFFSSLKPVAEKTRLSLEELTNAAQEAAGAFRGQLDANALRGVLGKFGDLVRTGEFSWGEIFSTAGTMQRLSPNQQIAAAHFAAVGGYQFRNTDALGRAYELQRMGGKNIGEQTKALRDAIRGVLISSRGSDRWDLLTDAQKYTYGNYVLSGMGLTDFYKQPGGELLMEKIMTNGLFTNDDITAWENATTNSTEKIAQKMEAIINPLNYINTYVAALAVNAGAGKVGEWAQKAIDEFVDKQTHLDVHIFNKFGSSVGVELGLNRSAGMPVPIKVDPQAGGN